MKERGKRRLVFVAVLCVLTLLLSGGTVWAAESTSDVVVDSAQKQKLRQDIVGNLQLPGEEEEYVVGYKDILSITIYGEGDMAASNVTADGRSSAVEGGQSSGRSATGGVDVRMDGRVSLKHIGDIKVVGMSLPQVADYLKKLYAAVFDDPIVTVTLLKCNSRRYTIMGKVNNPGVFQIEFPVTIVEAVARSGGFSQWANNEVTVIQQGRADGAGKTKGGKTVQFDYDDFLKGKGLENNVYIQPNDVIIVH